MTVLSVEIPFTPTYDMTPNGRVGWRKKARLNAQAKSTAHYATLAALEEDEAAGIVHDFATATEIKVMIVIRWEPGRKRFDDDNALSGCKSLRDGVASAIGCDDKMFRVLSIKQEKDPDGRGVVCFTLMPVGTDTP